MTAGVAPRSAASAPVAASHTGRLVLTPADPHVIPQVGLLIEMLADKGFVGESLGTSEEQAYRIGPGFLSLMTFAGCAVRIQSDPDRQGGFCHIRVLPAREHPSLLVGRNTRAPRCVGCRARLVDWREHTAHWASHPHAGVTCPQCGETRPPWLWDWKEQGGFGRLFILVEEIFPSEATPAPALFDLLIRASGTGWRHFYVQD
ncbi:hypothetical protein G3480_14750 [Thiorhodococcus mannitoliphagus]|uniref:Uncharacterized protein n=1 Tax=Thiorhodococcus mannitoliphagus TaxID=329406 RepID=A0A6P1DWP7_9GAMM|nr:hypothetical protein [Thiorhodococcus mannitoliphagus]